MRTLTYVSAVLCLLFLALQAALIVSVWVGPKENRIQLMGVPMLAPFVFVPAAITFVLAQRLKEREDEQSRMRIHPVALQRVAIAVIIVQGLMFLVG